MKMKRVIIDGRLFSDMADVHTFLRSALDLPEYYGNNLDALYDCLTQIGHETAFEFIDMEVFCLKTGKKARMLKSVFEDAAAENPNIRII